MKKYLPLFLPLIFFVLFFSIISTKNQTSSANLTTVKDTLSSSQLSYFNRMGTGVSTSDTLLRVQTSGNPSNSTANLFTNDVVAIGRTGSNTSLTNYTVLDIASTNSFSITSSIAGINSNTGVAIIATRSAIHTVSFNPVANYTAGIFQFLIKASSRVGETYNDGIPDQQGFDFGMDVGSTTIGSGTALKTADVTCPLGATASIGTTTVIGSSSYHVINCTLGAGVTNVVGVGYSMVIGRALASGSQLVNPAPALSHIEGNADGSTDVYTFYVRHLDSGSVVRDSTQGKIAVIESVRVTATVDPSLTFTIDATNAGQSSTRCGNTLGAAAANTTPTAVQFGTLSLGAFNDLAQRLSITTNAPNGYVVTTYASAPLTMIGAGTTIPHTTCDGGSCTISSATEWSSNTTDSGFGYSLENVNVGVTVFNYNTGGNTFRSKPFGTGSANAANIMTNTSTPSSTERAYVCYRLVSSTTQPAGTYENKIVYTATATF